MAALLQSSSSPPPSLLEEPSRVLPHAERNRRKKNVRTLHDNVLDVYLNMTAARVMSCSCWMLQTERHFSYEAQLEVIKSMQRSELKINYVCE